MDIFITYLNGAIETINIPLSDEKDIKNNALDYLKNVTGLDTDFIELIQGNNYDEFKIEPNFFGKVLFKHNLNYGIEENPSIFMRETLIYGTPDDMKICIDKLSIKNRGLTKYINDGIKYITNENLKEDNIVYLYTRRLPHGYDFSPLTKFLFNRHSLLKILNEISPLNKDLFKSLFEAADSENQSLGFIQNLNEFIHKGEEFFYGLQILNQNTVEYMFKTFSFNILNNLHPETLSRHAKIILKIYNGHRDRRDLIAYYIYCLLPNNYNYNRIRQRDEILAAFEDFDKNERTSTGETILHLAATYCTTAFSFEFFYNKFKTLYDEKDSYGNSIMLAASKNSFTEPMQFLFNKNPDSINDLDNKGEDVFQIAARFGKKDILSFLIEQKIKPKNNGEGLFTLAYNAKFGPKMRLCNFLYKNFECAEKEKITIIREGIMNGKDVSDLI